MQESILPTATTKAARPILSLAKDKLHLRREMATGTISATFKIHYNQRSLASGFHRGFSEFAVNPIAGRFHD